MAAPMSKTIGDLNGKWLMNKTLSDNPEPALSLQGIGFLIRKGIGLATVTLAIRQYPGPPNAPHEAKGGEYTHFDVDQTASGGIKGTAELRCLDNEWRPHSDWLFGRVTARSRWVADDAELAALAAEYGLNLGEGWITDAAEQTGPDGAKYVFSWVEADAGWTAAQVWGFVMLGGERRYARQLIVKKGAKDVKLRFIYDFVPE